MNAPTKKQQLEQRREINRIERERKEAEKGAAINACRVVTSSRLPKEYQEWGVVRSKAYLKALGGVHRLVRRFDSGARIGCKQFKDALAKLNDAATLPIEEIAKRAAANKLEKGMRT